MNKDEDGDSSAATLAPPPKTSDMSFRVPAIDRAAQLGAHNDDIPAIDTPKSGTTSNMFKLSRGRSMRANYVDVMNPNGSKNNATLSNTPMTSPLSSMPVATSSPQLFVPAPSESSSSSRI